jgi:hypothetical protein
MIGLLCFALAVLASPFKSKLRLEAENAVLRHQLNILRRRLHGRVQLTNHDRWFFVQIYRFPSILKVLTIFRPETLVRWHRAGFRCLCVPKTLSVDGAMECLAGGMIGLFCFVLAVLASPFKSKLRLGGLGAGPKAAP